MQNFDGGKTLANQSFYEFRQGKYSLAMYFSEPGIWLGKILANSIRFSKFAKVFPHQIFALYGIYDLSIWLNLR